MADAPVSTAGSESPKEDATTRADARRAKAYGDFRRPKDDTRSEASSSSSSGSSVGQVASPKKKRVHDEFDDEGDALMPSQGDKDEESAAAADGTGAAVAGDVAATDAGNGSADVSSSRTVRDGPEKKRLRDHEQEETTKTGEADAKAAGAENPADAKPTSSSAFASSGFAKLTSTSSPFGALAGSGAKPLFGSPATTTTTTTTTTNTSTATTTTASKVDVGGAAAASPFASLAGASSTSTSSSSKPSVFGSAFASATATKPAASTPSVFGSSTTGSSVFGSAFGSGPRLTSFAKPGGVFKSDKPAKPFGAPESEGEQSDDDGDKDGKDGKKDKDSNKKKNDDKDAEGAEEDAEKKTDEKSEEKKKPKLQRVHVDDGEAGEATILQVRARMYYLDKEQGGWKERGAGMLKLNVPEQCVDFDRSGAAIPASFDASMLDDGKPEDKEEKEDKDAKEAKEQKEADPEADPESKPTTTAAAAVPKRSVVRLIMRQDSTHRVILNTVVLAAMVFEERQMLKATTVLFTAFEGAPAQPVSVQVKMNIANAKTFMATMEGVQKELPATEQYV